LVEADDDKEDDSSMMGRHEIDREKHGLVAPSVPLRQRINTIISTWPQTTDARAALIRSVINRHFEEAQERWDTLYSFHEHVRLCDAIMDQVTNDATKK
jgi:hypothetical protein